MFQWKGLSWFHHCWNINDQEIMSIHYLIIPIKCDRIIPIVLHLHFWWFSFIPRQWAWGTQPAALSSKPHFLILIGPIKMINPGESDGRWVGGWPESKHKQIKNGKMLMDDGNQNRRKWLQMMSRPWEDRVDVKRDMMRREVQPQGRVGRREEVNTLLPNVWMVICHH